MHSKPIPSGDPILDELLSGGFRPNLVYILYGDKRIVTNILLRTAVNVQKPIMNGGFGEEHKVAFLDGNNRFNPYNIGKYAVTHHLQPHKVLENILIARIFMLDQLDGFSNFEGVKTLLISGVNSIIDNFDKRHIEIFLTKIERIKSEQLKENPLIILTALSSEDSLIKSKEIGRLSRVNNVLVIINDDERYIEYLLVKNPNLPASRMLKRKPRRPKDLKPSRNTTLDSWF